MNAEQKQRALTALGMWHSNNDGSQREYQSAELMVALLQELVDAPEAEPVARVTGYYAGYLFIATVDWRVLPAGTELYLAPPASSVPDGWIRAVDEAMVVHHIGIADRADSYEVATKKLNALLAITSDIARDCSEPPADVARDAERYRWLLENARATAEHWGGRWSLVIDSPAPGKDASPEAINAAIDAAIERQGASDEPRL